MYVSLMIAMAVISTASSFQMVAPIQKMKLSTRQLSTRTAQKMRLTRETNYCRVFELPKIYPNPAPCMTSMMMVDELHPIPPAMLWFSDWNEWKPAFIEYLKKKPYIKPGYKYLVLCDFGETLVIER